jgi:hypothetical protein
VIRKRWALAAAVAVYLLLAGAQAFQLDGLQYDESLMVLGSVQMRNSPAILPLPQDPHTWTCIRGRCFPLMTVRYVGALKEYLTIPAMGLLGSGPEAVRLVSILWASLAVWGAGRLADQTAFDNGAVAGWSGALGLLLTALARWREKQSGSRSFWLGAAAGLGVWCRANFLWLLLAGLAAVAWSALRWAREFPRHAALGATGLLLGSAPFWVYQVTSRGGTFEAVGMFQAEGSVPELLASRAAMFGRSLLSDFEHRAIWSGPELPVWQSSLVAAFFLAAWACGLSKAGLPRQSAVSTAIFFGFLFFSRLPVAEHHFAPALPLAAGVAWLGARSHARLRPGWLAAAAIYCTLAVHWQLAAIRGIRETGGTGQWSDAISKVNAYLLDNHAEERVRILDWGLQNNLFVLSDARLKTVEDFGEQWEARVAEGGLFLLNGPGHTFFAAPRAAFLRALEESGKRVEPVEFRERRGAVFAELWRVPAGRLIELLEGFHSVEPGGWRWTRKSFSLAVNAGAAGDRTIEGVFFFPEVLVSRLGPVTMTASSAGKLIGSKTVSKAGDFRFVAPLPASEGRAIRLEFRLDKALAPGVADARELGVISRSFHVGTRLKTSPPRGPVQDR